MTTVQPGQSPVSDTGLAPFNSFKDSTAAAAVNGKCRVGSGHGAIAIQLLEPDQGQFDEFQELATANKIAGFRKT